MITSDQDILDEIYFCDQSRIWHFVIMYIRIALSAKEVIFLDLWYWWYNLGGLFCILGS